MAFSIGGLVLSGRLPSPVTFITVFSRSNYTNGTFQLDSERISLVRATEDIAWALLAKVDREECGADEAGLRHGATFDAIFADEGEVEETPDWLVADLTNRIGRLAPTLILAPLGLGRHRDHICLSYAAEELSKGVKAQLGYYEDLPYAYSFDPEAISEAATTLLGVAIPLSIAFGPGRLEEKISNLAVYSSQIDEDTKGAIREHALRLDPTNGAERLWGRTAECLRIILGIGPSDFGTTL